MNLDISNILADWEYEPSGVRARYVEGRDGRQKIQLRLDLGVFQMELEGRPDGLPQRGYPTLLEYYQTLEKTSRPKELELTPDVCTELQQEAVQYYYRYLARFSLKDYDGVIQDTRHNLEIFDLVARHAGNDEVAWEFLQYKPYVFMMSARASAEKDVAEQNWDRAQETVSTALDAIQSFWQEHGEEELKYDSYEIQTLTEFLQDLKERRPPQESDRLKKQLDHAIRMEDFEKAAWLRDQIHALETQEEEVVLTQKNAG